LIPCTREEDRPIHNVVARIEKHNDKLRNFWSDAAGWAPIDAAELMSKSRLDRQVSLSRSLRHWIEGPPADIEDGDLILGWTNLGSLIERTTKLFLAVYYLDERALTRLVQSRRNAVHAFKDRPIGTGAELHLSIRRYLTMQRRLANALPYPDDSYRPREI
jgi:hypothetical protein